VTLPAHSVPLLPFSLPLKTSSLKGHCSLLLSFPSPSVGSLTPNIYYFSLFQFFIPPTLHCESTRVTALSFLLFTLILKTVFQPLISLLFLLTSTSCLLTQNHDFFQVLMTLVTKISTSWYVTLCSPLKINRHFEGTCRLHLRGKLCFMLVSCLTYSSTTKMEVTCSSKKSVDFQGTTQCHILEDRNLHSLRCSHSYWFAPRPSTSLCP
jgi:hypothetical protein